MELTGGSRLFMHLTMSARESLRPTLSMKMESFHSKNG